MSTVRPVPAVASALSAGATDVVTAVASEYPVPPYSVPTLNAVTVFLSAAVLTVIVALFAGDAPPSTVPENTSVSPAAYPEPLLLPAATAYTVSKREMSNVAPEPSIVVAELAVRLL